MTSPKALSQVEIDWIKELADSGMNLREVARTAEISSSTLHAIKRRGWVVAPAPKRRTVPSDWLTVAPGQSIENLRIHYGTSFRVAQRWMREQPVDRQIRYCTHQYEALPIPADFDQMLGELSETKLAAHYGRCRDTIAKWRRARITERAAAEAARVAALTPFERQMEAVRNGRGVVRRFTPRRVEPSFTLGGVSEMAA